MKKKIIIGIICFVVLLVCWIGWYYLLKNDSKWFWLNLSSRESDWDIHVLPSIDDEVVGDSMWCGTFQLVWNDMIREVVKQDVVFTPQLEMAENLNKQTFTIDQLSPSGYYVKFWLFTKSLKRIIEAWIKEKFNETSDVLDKINREKAPENDDWYWDDYKEYLFYAMLKKVFNFEKEFDVLDKWNFDGKYKDIEYFWIDDDSSSELYSQVNVLYYNSDNDFAVILETKEWEDVILERGTGGESFNEIYKNVIKKSEKYDWKQYFCEDDYLKVPKISVNSFISYDDFKDKYFFAADGGTCEIMDALQTIQLELDEKWGSIKSEALIHMSRSNSISFDTPEKHEYRYFYFDKPYVMLLKEADKDLPYFAAQISDITLFQN